MADLEYPNIRLNRLAFGSCAKNRIKDQPIWDSISSKKPDAFFWIGDAHYEDCGAPDCMQRGFEEQKEIKQYKNFRESGLIIDGVYDDHDYGVNDGDSLFPFRREAQQLFLNFLGVPIDPTHPRREREGLYSSHTFGTYPNQVKVILLDTRYFRTPAAVGNFAQYAYPGTSQIASLMRATAAYFGLYEDFSGDMLGSEQWLWLERQLYASKASVNIIASSIQVYSNNPFLEGWGHYPKSLNKLNTMISTLKPKGLFFLSGDVHFAEVSGMGVFELTSSGFTHTCSDGLNFMAPLIVNSWPGNNNRYKGLVFLEKNFGVVDFEWKGDKDSHDVNIVGRIFDERGVEVFSVNELVRDSDAGQSRKFESLSTLHPTIRHRSMYFRSGHILVLVTLTVSLYLILSICLTMPRRCKRLIWWRSHTDKKKL
eukprot:GHVR01166534.1.p1 GENE.GHVR01166534.1~~GHVR01166534.1.p1  ORF type:complete len:425 (+),score=83.38 GHVR01166534.1:46-1320(+)